MSSLIPFTITFNSTWWQLITKVNTNTLIVPLIPKLPDNYQLIINIEVDDEIKAQYVGIHRVDSYQNIFNLFNNLYSIFEANANTNFIATQRLQQLNTAILTANQINEIVNNYPLSTFELGAQINCDTNEST